MKQIPLSQGLFALVDDSDYEFLMQWKWTANKERKTFTAYRQSNQTKKRTFIYMHRLIMNMPEKGVFVDHIDGNGLNNQRCNLRLCTNAENLMNRGANKNNTSGYKGVTWHKKISKWQSQIMLNRKNIKLGYFSDKTDAARAYNEAAKKYFGEFAKINEL